MRAMKKINPIWFFVIGLTSLSLACSLPGLTGKPTPTPVKIGGPFTLSNAAVTTSSGLTYEDLVVGEGTAARVGDTVSAIYTGYLEDDTIFDSNVDSGVPIEFQLGTGYVIPGWDEGLVGMRVGGTRLLVIPPDLGYGSLGASGVIPPNATLTFTVMLLGIK